MQLPARRRQNPQKSKDFCGFLRSRCKMRRLLQQLRFLPAVAKDVRTVLQSGKKREAGTMKKALWITALTILSAALLRHFLLEGFAGTVGGLVRSFLYFGLFTAWGVSLRRRILPRQPRAFLLAVAGLILLWLSLRTVKYVLAASAETSRYLWYAYYPPMLLIPTMGVFAAMSLGRPEDYRLPGRTKLILLPPAALSLLVMTNDLHQLVFSFPAGAAWTDRSSMRGGGYWACAAWMLLCGLAMLFLLILRSRAPRSGKSILLPFAPLAAAAAYTALYAAKAPLLHVLAGDVTVALCLLFASVFECCIQCGLIRSNTHYREFFADAPLNAQILDRQGHALLLSKNAGPVSPEEFRSLASCGRCSRGDLELRMMPVAGGYTVWETDLREVNRLLEALGDVHESLLSQTQMKAREEELRSEAIRVEARRRLVDEISLGAKEALDRLSGLLDEAERGEGEPERILFEIALLGAYIKRRGNLVTIRQSGERTGTTELKMAAEQTMDVLQLGGIGGVCAIPGGREMDISRIIACYDLLGWLTRTLLPALGCVTASLVFLHDGCRFSVTARTTAEAPEPPATLCREFAGSGAEFSLEREDGLTACLRFGPEGGDGE
jgi:hypothetical protein